MKMKKDNGIYTGSREEPIAKTGFISFYPRSQCDQHSIMRTYRIRTASPAVNRLAFPLAGFAFTQLGWPSGDWYCFIIPFCSGSKERYQHSLLPAIPFETT